MKIILHRQSFRIIIGRSHLTLPFSCLTSSLRVTDGKNFDFSLFCLLPARTLLIVCVVHIYSILRFFLLLPCPFLIPSHHLSFHASKSWLSHFTSLFPYILYSLSSCLLFTPGMYVCNYLFWSFCLVLTSHPFIMLWETSYFSCVVLSFLTASAVLEVSICFYATIFLFFSFFSFFFLASPCSVDIALSSC